MLEREFPILKRKIKGQKLVYLDSASTAQKPNTVVRAVSNFYLLHNANIHRGIHTLSQEATEAYENVRDKIQKFINAKYREEIIFTKGATEAINLVVWTWGHHNVKRGDEILLTEMEHHSNLVPWQVLAKKKGAKLKFIPLTKSYRLKADSLSGLITKRTKIAALTHVSNVLGTINPVKKIISAVQKKGAMVLLDGAQAGGHIPIDVQKLGCDFYALSGHKMYGPTGVGVLYGRKNLLENMPPYQYGGHMIKQVKWHESTWADLPHKFEAGTTNIAQVVGLGAAIDFINSIGMGRIVNHELEITEYTLNKLKKIPGLKIYGPSSARNRTGVISFTLEGIPGHDLASILDENGVAIRTGHHCTMPLHRKLGVESTARISLGLYNTKKDIDRLIKAIRHARTIFTKST